MAASQFEQWFQRKLARKVKRLTGLTTVAYEYERVLGPRSLYARVSLSVTPSEEFRYESRVQWPPEVGDYDNFVLDGILDAVFGWEYDPLVAHFALVDVGYHPVHSAPIAYYMAAKRAVHSLLIERGQER